MKKVLLTLIAILSCMTMSAQWSGNPAENNRITMAGQTNYGYETVMNKDGITYLLSLVPHTTADNVTMMSFRIQILDKAGNKLLPDSGKVICNERARSYTMINQHMMADNDGNAIIAACDSRNSAADAINLSYTIYKISPTGEILWDGKGVDINKGKSYDFIATMRMITLDDGSYEFAYERENGELTAIDVIHLSKDGAFLWENPVSLIDKTTSYAYPFFVNAGDNQSILVYAKGTNQDIMARKIDFDGSSVWSADTKVYRGGFPAQLPLHTIVDAIPAPDGGVFVTWYDDRSTTGSFSNYISLIKNDGSYGFTTGIEGTKLSNTSEYSCMTPKMAYNENEKCLYTVWRQFNQAAQNYRGLFMQKLSLAGELLWGSEGKALVDLQDAKSYGYATVQNAGGSNVAAFYMESAGYGHVQSYAQKFDKDGNALWNKLLSFTTTDSEKSDLLSSTLVDNSYWITNWGDVRDTSKISGVYMQRINIDGTLGTPTGIKNSTLNNDLHFNAVANNQVINFNVALPETGNAIINLLTIDGQKVATAYNGTMNQGVQSFTWSATNLNEGIYLATLTTMSGTKTIRIYIK